MAVSAKILSKSRAVGAERVTETDVTMDASYAKEGEPLTPKELGLRVVYRTVCTVKIGSEAEATAVGSVFYNKSKQKLVVNSYKTQKEIAEATNLEKVVVNVIAWGA